MIRVERANLVVATRSNKDSSFEALVGRKKRGVFVGMTTFPGGKVEWNGSHFENAKHAAQREFEEETGIRMGVETLRRAGRIRLYGDRFGMIDVYHTELTDQEPRSTDEMDMFWRVIGSGFYEDMPEDTADWLPLVFSQESFRINTAWEAGRLCMVAFDTGNPLSDIKSFYEHSARNI